MAGIREQETVYYSLHIQLSSQPMTPQTGPLVIGYLVNYSVDIWRGVQYWFRILDMSTKSKAFSVSQSSIISILRCVSHSNTAATIAPDVKSSQFQLRHQVP